MSLVKNRWAWFRWVLFHLPGKPIFFFKKATYAISFPPPPFLVFLGEVHKNASLPFMEVFVDAPLAAVEGRDPKGLYKSRPQSGGRLGNGWSACDACKRLTRSPSRCRSIWDGPSPCYAWRTCVCVCVCVCVCGVSFVLGLV